MVPPTLAQKWCAAHVTPWIVGGKGGSAVSPGASTDGVCESVSGAHQIREIGTIRKSDGTRTQALGE